MENIVKKQAGKKGHKACLPGSLPLLYTSTTLILLKITLLKIIINYLFMMFDLYHFIFSTAFVKGDKPQKFPNLTIRYVRGLDPIIKLMDENDVPQEVR